MRRPDSKIDSRFTTVVAAAAVMGMLGGGVGFAAATIGSVDIVDGGVRSVDIKDNTVKLKDIGKRAQNKLKGQAGPAGPAGPSGSGETVVTQIGPALPFDGTNASVSLTPDGFEWGPYADAGSAGGSICWKGLNGQPLTAIKSMSYNVRYSGTGVNGNNAGSTQGFASPYLRIYLASNDGVAPPDGPNQNRIIFSPNTQSPDPDLDEGEFNEYVVTSGGVRFQDDGGNGPDSPFATVVAAHPGETIQDDICISQGFSAGDNVNGLLRWWEINGTKYVFRGQ